MSPNRKSRRARRRQQRLALSLHGSNVRYTSLYEIRDTGYLLKCNHYDCNDTSTLLSNVKSLKTKHINKAVDYSHKNTANQRT